SGRGGGRRAGGRQDDHNSSARCSVFMIALQRLSTWGSAVRSSTGRREMPCGPESGASQAVAELLHRLVDGEGTGSLARGELAEGGQESLHDRLRRQGQ